MSDHNNGRNGVSGICRTGNDGLPQKREVDKARLENDRRSCKGGHCRTGQWRTQKSRI